MKEITKSLAEKLILKENRNMIALFHLNKEKVIVSPYSDAGEYSRNLKVLAIEKSINKLSQEYFLPEEILETYFEYIDWSTVIVSQIVSEEFIDNFREELDWLLVCKFQELSEDFIKNHLKYIDDRCWEVIWQTQILSDTFTSTHKDKFPVFEKDSRMSKEFSFWWESRNDIVVKIPTSSNKIYDDYTARHTRQVLAQNELSQHNSVLTNRSASYWDKVPNISDERRAEMRVRAEERAFSDNILAQEQARQIVEFDKYRREREREREKERKRNEKSKNNR